MLKREVFDRSTLPSGPIKLLTLEQMKRSEVKVYGNADHRDPAESSSKRVARLSIPRRCWEDERNGDLGGDLGR